MIYVRYTNMSELPAAQEVHGLLTVEGHADFSPPEMPDIVCAAVSAQVQAFLLFLRARHFPCRISEADGRTDAEFLSGQGRTSSIELWAAVQMLLMGLRAVAHDYPDNVIII